MGIYNNSGQLEEVWERVSEIIAWYWKQAQRNVFLICCRVVLIAQSCPTEFVTPWTIARQVPLFMEFSRQEY